MAKLTLDFCLSKGEGMWYVIWALAKKENELIGRIGRLVPEELYTKAWTPVKTELRKYRGQEKQMQVKLFPGYVFVDTDSPEMIHERLRREKDYIKFLKSGEEFVPVSETERATIEWLTGGSGIAGISYGIIEDGTLKVLDGPLKGMEKDIVKIDRHHRKAWVRLKHMLGKDRTLSFGLEVAEKT